MQRKNFEVLGALDIDGNILNLNAPGNYILNEPLLDAYLELGITDIVLFTNMDLGTLDTEFGAIGGTQNLSLKRKQIVDELTKRGFKIHAVVTPADQGYQKGLGQSYQDYYLKYYEKFENGDLKAIDSIENEEFQQAFKEVRKHRDDAAEDPDTSTLRDKYEEDEGYKLELISMLPDNNINKAETGKIYLSSEGDYFVRDPKGLIQKGSFKGLRINLDDLPNRLNDEILKNYILTIALKRGHINDPAFNIKGGLFNYLINQVNAKCIVLSDDEESPLDTIKYVAKEKFQGNYVGLKVDLEKNSPSPYEEKNYFSIKQQYKAEILKGLTPENRTYLERKRFWPNYRDTIMASVITGATTGALSGAAVGLAMGVFAAIPTGGISLLGTPAAIGILGAVGAVVGAITGLVTGLVGSIYQNKTMDKKFLDKIEQNELANQTRNTTDLHKKLGSTPDNLKQARFTEEKKKSNKKQLQVKAPKIETQPIVENTLLQTPSNNSTTPTKENTQVSSSFSPNPGRKK